MFDKIKEKRKQMANKMNAIEKESDQIFTKLNPQYKLKDGSFPKAGSIDASPEYNREYNRTYNQVKKTRLAQ